MNRSTPTYNQKSYRIGEVTRLLGLSADTLRYYERIGLMNGVGRVSGARRYNERDLSCLRFIQRAQNMNFTLNEIGRLLRMREAPHQARKSARALTARKLVEVKARLEELRTLHDELQLLVNLCSGSRKGCAILREIDKG